MIAGFVGTSIALFTEIADILGVAAKYLMAVGHVSAAGGGNKPVVPGRVDGWRSPGGGEQEEEEVNE
ncbi:hypothetical protein LTR56_016723 [Elasticomyces elasticus]|nr:hypothetical protein LTR56_016723 [Elasticomyces elasticus]KAK4905662.1 hypothetical protein LTR49_025051 [Elasticomyces elasticus]KAK5750635.1 hypothetical protein LTS12_019342 [Elasticomyces elasticus]